MLTLNDDVLYLICTAAEDIDLGDQRFFGHGHGRKPPPALLSLCMTCKRLRAVGSPLIYLKATICGFGNCCQGISDPFVLLRSIEECESFKRYGRTLVVNFWNRPLPLFAHSLKSTLPKLPLLGKLRLSGSSAQGFHEAFSSIDFRLPHLRSLVLSDELQTLALQFPEVTSLRFTRSFTGHVNDPNAVISRGTRKSLRRLEISSYQPGGNCTPGLLQSLKIHCPNITTFGTLSSGRAGKPFTTLLPSLAELPSLTVLAIDSIERLGTLDPPHVVDEWSSHREDQTVEWQARKVQTLREIARGTFEHCRQLRVFWMREQGKATCIRGADSCVEDVIWEDGERPEVFLSVVH